MKYKKLMIYSLLTTMLAMPITAFATENPAEIQEQAQVNEQITGITIEPEKYSDGYFKDRCLKNGNNIVFTVKVYLEDGSVATGEATNAKVACELRKKDGTPMQAAYSCYNPVSVVPADYPSSPARDDYASIAVYAPYGYEEELQLTVYALNNKSVRATYDFKTVSNPSRSAFSQFTLGKTAGRVKLSSVKEAWNAKECMYEVTLPQVKTTNKKDWFAGWRYQGKVYAPGKKVMVEPYALRLPCSLSGEFQAVWKISKGTVFTVKDGKSRTCYKVTGDSTVAVTKITGAKIPDTVKYKDQSFQVTSIAKSAVKNTKIRTLVIGRNVTKIEKGAFGKNKSLKTIIIRSGKIRLIGKNAFKNISKNVTIKCPKAKSAAYKKLFRKAGLNKKVKVRGI